MAAKDPSASTNILSHWYAQIFHFIKTEGIFHMVEHVIIAILIIKLLIHLFKIQSRGKQGIKSYLTKLFLRFSTRLGYFKNKKESYMEIQAAKSAQGALQKKKVKMIFEKIPDQGLKSDQILQILQARVDADINPTAGKTFAYVYEHSKAHTQLTEDCFVKYLHSNALNPIMFNSLRVIENEVIRMCADLFHGPPSAVGNITSCGTQSLLLAMKTYRNYRGPGEVIMCTTGHPGINKGCHYVGLEVVQISYDQKKRMSLKELRKRISRSTVLVVCSAPQYPYGVVDDVGQISKICLQYGVPLHVDAAIGGFVLPFIQMQNRAKFKPWDFRIEGVTSINADLHKYGYAPKGSSALIYRNSSIRRHQYFSFSTWPGGIYISPTAMGTRNGGCFSSAWGSLLDLGINGFRKVTSSILDTVDEFVKFVKNNEQLQLIAEPDSTIVSFKCRNFSCYKLADAMESRGYHLEKQSNPESLHMTFMPSHIPLLSQIIQSIKNSLEEIATNPTMYQTGSKAMYGMMAAIPDQVFVEDFVVFYMDQLYKMK